MKVNDGREFLRHILATIAYRGGKAVREASPNFVMLQISRTSRTPSQILAHIGDLFDWTLTMARGKQEWHDSTPLPWAEEVDRFFRTVAALDAYLASDEPLATPAEKIFQGPLADALTHIGQLTMLRRASGSPIKGENYSNAAIETGRVGRDQAPPKREFD
jgi:hypothetical protein